ncbi:MAG: biotin/lipoate A/B protein ligase family protein [Candidatus Zixiibacteriota bacterium]
MSAVAPLRTTGLRHAEFHIDPARDALWNMSCDNWMATSAPLMVGTGIFRVYQWRPAGLTIGVNQRWERALDISALSPGEIAVRRITGGRAIYHDSSELTYSLALELSHLGPAEVNAVSGAVSWGIMQFLRSSGLEPEFTSSRKARPLNHGQSSRHCFDSLARHEITVGGKKVAAGAQRVFPTRYFQHGSIKLSGARPHPALHGSADLPRSHDTGQKESGDDDSRAGAKRAKLLSLSGFMAEAFGVSHEVSEWSSTEDRIIGRDSHDPDICVGFQSQIPDAEARST